MARNVCKVNFGEEVFLVIDLTLPFSMDQQGYPGDSPPARNLVSDIHKEGWQHYTHTMGDHCFHPHCDAPNHFDPSRQDQGMEIYDLSWSFHRACMIDLTGLPEAEVHEGIRFLTEITIDHLIPYGNLLSSAEAVILRTGYDLWVERNHVHRPEWLPFLTEEASEFITSFPGIHVVGTDSLTVDAHGLQVSHRALKHTMIVESLVHLYDIPEENRRNFILQTTPVRIVGSTGGPVVAYAYIQIHQ